MNDTTPTELEAVLDAAAQAAPALAASAPRVRAEALVAAADALDGAADELVPIAMRETGLAEARLRGELKRTTVQLRLFAETVVDGAYLDVRIDDADPDFVLGPRPEVRRYLVPLGPVLNFAASNFPFAFSVAGGDSAAALAAGSPVVVKAHEGHPELSQRTAEIVATALVAAGLPEGTFGIVFGRDSGITALRDPRIAAAAFTGSTGGGVALAAIAANRPVPIPFFGELGSVNPVFVTPAAAEAGLGPLAEAFVASVSGSAGQLCTKSGFLFVPRGADLPVAAPAAGVAPHRLLHAGIADGFRDRRERILSTDGVETVAGGDVTDDEAGAWATPTIARTDVATLRREREALLDEAFGPLAIVVDYDDPADLPGLVDEFFPGNLTGTIQTAPGEDPAGFTDLAAAIAAHSGRVIVNGWPTGVAVTPAMTHGGPFPATVGGAGTSVGTAAISRFLRPVTYQNAPDGILPPPLRDDNPWGVPQRRSSAGESASWGQLAASAGATGGGAA
ncbi:NADP-dependent aldehyde dehydrogenase [Labedella gwakjiensis]|uniref:Aldehyde dehydrogenase (NADP(+)) n=1 Tax=Labedella gwakjiensis TaxID=390269 RepID=A0A2P8GWL8_9MICO|nr:aldehyde dehydrogenase (NADP(+)) [Labedella gwakjiensis]PSL38360.1 NADP-dependent aldehyde dehydrogenase [Labedella gwakjiensis]RUQ87109.1 aldehyde dehydrogenase (NADP(+)) [Labedella gwakjiensis]